MTFVSCIMPTADRRRFVPEAIRLFLAQDHADAELIVLDDGADAVADLIPPDPRVRYLREEKRAPVGAKRNRAVQQARGEIIAHWDDDDWYAPWRLGYQVQALREAGADACGLDRVIFRNELDSAAWEYVWPAGAGTWLHGATLCYRRSLWEQGGFSPLAVGEDMQFLRTHARASWLALPRTEFYVGRIHAANTSRKLTADSRWRRSSADVLALTEAAPAGRSALVAAGAGVGDILRTTPLIRALHRMGYAVDVLLAPHSAGTEDLLRGASEVRRVLLEGEPVAERYDVAAFGYWATALAGQVRAARVLTMPRDRWLADGDSACLERMARELGWTETMPLPFAVASARRFDLLPGTIALHPGCKPDWPWKRWHGFAELAALLAEVVVVGTEVDRDHRGSYFARSFDWPAHVRDFTAQLSLPDTAALIGQCAALVSNDSGLMHLGVALGVPTIGVFGITSPAREAMPSPAMVPVSKGLDCEPECRRGPWGRRDCARHLECLSTLTAAQVKARLDAALALEEPPLRVTYSAAVFDATGYGQAARLYVHALHRAGVRVAVTHSGAQPPQVEDPLVASLLGEDEEADFHIFHGVPPWWARAAFPRRRVVAVTVWETDTMPQSWRSVLTHAIDVWLPSRFNVDVFARSLGRIPFLLAHALPDRASPADPIALSGLEEGDFVFYAMFEWQDRKNPEGAMEAFLRAFPVANDAVLVLKCGPGSSAEAQMALAAARSRTGSQGRVLLAAGSWTPAQMTALQARGNCYVSLHRGEGWGYPLFEAAARGTPVIATAYSGPLDYLDPAAHWLVHHRLAPVRQRYAFYQPSMRWAEPDLGHAAEGMRWIYEHRVEAGERAEAAAAALREAHSLERIGASAKARLLALRNAQAQLPAQAGPAQAGPAVPLAPPPPAPPPVPIPGSWYDADYFEHGRTSNWTGGYRWTNLQQIFRDAAQWLTDTFPEAQTVLDIGCAKGFLVRTLRERGVAACGVDHSAWAISHADAGARAYLHLAGIDDMDWPQGCDLLVAMHVLESLTQAQLQAFLPRARGWVKQGLVAVIAAPGPAGQDRDATRVTQLDREGWRALFLSCGWRQDPLHRLAERSCAAHPVPRRMGWEVHVFAPGE